ncbi:hypothetical protein H6G33_10125 [Calothrix sp. FACHB-1219]|uniref:hypothetical protein n=1 Tax=unclassified Calothrix TaxID=2619626 RepID=UPI001689CC66|nr:MULTISPECIES: hypothetical protein [unclassified Calothrix]MBD2201704.1 hypothetical protein [Calothrix sp. FACHB-168]MBD2217390.1 hypothetical protein [Calothrix sp. FACHB-1219]
MNKDYPEQVPLSIGKSPSVEKYKQLLHRKLQDPLLPPEEKNRLISSLSEIEKRKSLLYRLIDSIFYRRKIGGKEGKGRINEGEFSYYSFSYSNRNKEITVIYYKPLILELRLGMEVKLDLTNSKGKAISLICKVISTDRAEENEKIGKFRVKIVEAVS